MELRGMVDAPIPALDERSSDWREIYFFRNSLRTLLEIRSTVETLKAQKSFLRSLSKEPHPLNGAFSSLAEALNRAHGVIKKLRREVGGHLSHEALEQGLAKIDLSTEGLVQVRDRAKDIHYKFGLEFLEQ